MTAKQSLKCGLVALIGRSNVGKSSLLNALIGTKIAITSPKPQTTRMGLQGVYNDDRGQIVFTDTPGIFLDANDILTKSLNEQAKEASSGVDLILYIVDPTRHIGSEEYAVHTVVRNSKIPTILVFNKSDQNAKYKNEYLAWADDCLGTVEVSAQKETGLKTLLQLVFDNLKEQEPLYPPGQLTNVSNDFWLAELIREKIFLKMRDEVPYTTTVVVTENSLRENGTRYISANIITTDLRYKKMLIGAGGQKLKAIGSSTRRELEEVGGQKIFLDLNVEIDPHWQQKMV